MDSLKNHFLIAMPSLGDPNFNETVTFICQHDAEGAIGIIVNRPSAVSLADVFDRLDIPYTPSVQAAGPVLEGGPVEPERGFVLHDSGSKFESTMPVGEAVSLTASRDALEAIASGNGPETAVLALGYAGWGAGQLEAEMAANSWLSVAASAEIIFQTPYDDRWRRAADLLGIDINGLTSYSGHA